MEFILVTEKETKQKVCVSIDKIISVVQCIDGTAFLETSYFDDGNSVGVYTTELFEDITSFLKVLKLGGK